MKNQLTSFILFCTVVFLASCSNFSNLSVEKRHYRGGYHVDYAKRNSTPEGVSANNKNELAEEKSSASTSSAPAAQVVPAELLPEVPATVNKERAHKPESVKKETYAAESGQGNNSVGAIKEIKRPFQAVRKAPAILKELKKNNDGNGLLIFLIVLILVLWLLGRFVFIVDLIDLLLLILVILLVIWLIKAL